MNPVGKGRYLLLMEMRVEEGIYCTKCFLPHFIYFLNVASFNIHHGTFKSH